MYQNIAAMVGSSAETRNPRFRRGLARAGLTDIEAIETPEFQDFSLVPSLALKEENRADSIFVEALGASGTDSRRRETRFPVKEESDDLSASQFNFVESEFLFLVKCGQFVDAIRHSISDDIRELNEDDLETPSEESIHFCLGLAESLAPYLATLPRVHIAPFLEDGGVIAFVIQSLDTERRATCRFSQEAQSQDIIMIDEAMNFREFSRSADELTLAKELAEWVLSRA